MSGSKRVFKLFGSVIAPKTSQTVPSASSPLNNGVSSPPGIESSHGSVSLPPPIPITAHETQTERTSNANDNMLPPNDTSTNQSHQNTENTPPIIDYFSNSYTDAHAPPDNELPTPTSTFPFVAEPPSSSNQSAPPHSNVTSTDMISPELPVADSTNPSPQNAILACAESLNVSNATVSDSSTNFISTVHAETVQTSNDTPSSDTNTELQPTFNNAFPVISEPLSPPNYSEVQNSNPNPNSNSLSPAMFITDSLIENAVNHTDLEKVVKKEKEESEYDTKSSSSGDGSRSNSMHSGRGREGGVREKEERKYSDVKGSIPEKNKYHHLEKNEHFKDKKIRLTKGINFFIIPPSSLPPLLTFCRA